MSALMRQTHGMSQAPPVSELLKEYRDALLSMHRSRIGAGGDPHHWNRLVNKMQALHLQLRESPEGRDGITSMIRDECLTVRQWSATNALAWDPGVARTALLQEIETEGPGAFEAQVTLREYDAGRLNTVWRPKA
jgi:hypothetical protein